MSKITQGPLKMRNPFANGMSQLLNYFELPLTTAASPKFFLSLGAKRFRLRLYEDAPLENPRQTPENFLDSIKIKCIQTIDTMDETTASFWV